MTFGSVGKAATKKHHKQSPFPATPYLHAAAENSAAENRDRQRRPSDPDVDQHVVDIAADYITTQHAPPSSLPGIKGDLPSRGALSRNSSFASQSAPPSPSYAPSEVFSEDSTVSHHPYTSRGAIRTTRMKGRTATANTRAPGIMEEEEQDEVRGLRSESKLGLGGLGLNQSSLSVGSRHKADKMLGLDPNAKLASMYMVSGLGKSTAEWSLADTDATRGVQPLEDSLGLFWRPEMLGSSFSGDKQDRTGSTAPEDGTRARKDSKSSTFTNGGLSKDLRGRHVADAGPGGAQRLVSKAIKFAHPRDVEVVNSALAPPTTCHAFSFSIPRQDTLAAVARERLGSAVSGMRNASAADLDRPAPVTSKDMTSATELTYYGVTLTVYSHADKDRALQLKVIKTRSERLKLGTQSSLNSMNPVSPNYHPPGTRKASTTSDRKRGRRHLGNLLRNQSEGDVTLGSETETGVSDSDMEGPLSRRRWAGDRLSVVESVPEDVRAVFDEQNDVFWMPYAITIVSRFPIYDTLQDYLRLSWARFSKNARVHMTQVGRLLNTTPPRPGEAIFLPVGTSVDDEVVLEVSMPGGLIDFDKGLVKVDFQIWPLFQALDLDHILTCAEVALSNSGRIIFCSKHPAMLNIAVSSLKYLVELRGWNGITVPVIHARDATFVIEDPGPYIIGMSTECRYLLVPPAQVVIVDIDTNSLSCRSPPPNVITPRPRREKSKHKLLAALGPSYPTDRSIPMEFKVSYPKGSFRPFNKMTWAKGEKPAYLGERLRVPGWWKAESVVVVFDKILADKHKKPSLIQRLTRSGVNRAQAQLTVGEQLAKGMMRRRARKLLPSLSIHYVEARDDLEVKVAKINRRLLRLIQEGEHWKSQFETFEKYADRLTVEANELKTKIERERKEARRLSSIANEQTKANQDLEEKLHNTESARAQAMRQLSDMHSSIQELEREREEIMNSIEMQIAGALNQYLPPPSPSISSRPSTPGHDGASPDITSVTRSLGRKADRPFTADSQRSGMSGMTGVSVLGHAKGERGKIPIGREGSVVETVQTVEGRLPGSLEGSIADRVANIQIKIKLEMALNVVSSQRASSSMTNRTNEESEGEDEEAYADADDDAETSANTSTETAVEEDDGSSPDKTLIEPPEVVSTLGLSDLGGEATSGEETDIETERGSRNGASRPPSVVEAEAILKGDFPPVPIAPVGIVGLDRGKTKIRPRRETAKSTVSVEDKKLVVVKPTAAADDEKVVATNKAKATKVKSRARPTKTATATEGIVLAHVGVQSDADSDSGRSDMTAGRGKKGRKGLGVDTNGKRLSAMSTASTTITFGKAV
ncbi:hypothetical protein L198_00341 [Cryptococcus wingfieldii CBS 7118]|uniref:UDENN domain-containing protein n=1 Tax=Cryptococcus wingfieldii CBS 7118 TaxID=1295528 RepID=A0A1E3K640_9TREE|nr:hypothetical protein L198_00341 [Cryptococcus wingfieldii CBS 7118]ODO08610.1 hypothetical protein L198_00341 [Cryptococcus wingfieldii CBS 7118]